MEFLDYHEYGIKYEFHDLDDGQIIELFDGDKSCAKMFLRLINHQINLSSVECDCPKLKGKCFNIFMRILVKERDQIFKKKLSPATEVALIISPEYRDGVLEKDAFVKLQKLYRTYGFLNYDKRNKPYAVSTLNLIDQVVNNNLVIIDDPNITPIQLYTGTPERPNKINNSEKEYEVHRKNLEKMFNDAKHRYMSSTVSSRSKSVNKGRGKKLSGKKLSGRKLSGRKLSGRKLSGKKLSGRKLSGRKLSGRKLSGRKLIKTKRKRRFPK